MVESNSGGLTLTIVSKPSTSYPSGGPTVPGSSTGIGSTFTPAQAQTYDKTAPSGYQSLYSPSRGGSGYHSGGNKSGQQKLDDTIKKIEAARQATQPVRSTILTGTQRLQNTNLQSGLSNYVQNLNRGVPTFQNQNFDQAKIIQNNRLNQNIFNTPQKSGYEAPKLMPGISAADAKKEFYADKAKVNQTTNELKKELGLTVMDKLPEKINLDPYVNQETGELNEKGKNIVKILDRLNVDVTVANSSAKLANRQLNWELSRGIEQPAEYNPQIFAADEGTVQRTKDALAEEEYRKKMNGGILTSEDRQYINSIQAGGGPLYSLTQGIQSTNDDISEKAKNQKFETTDDYLKALQIAGVSAGVGYAGGMVNFVDKAIPLKPGVGGLKLKEDYLITNPVSEFGIMTGQLAMDPVGVGGAIVSQIASNPLYEVPKFLGELEAFNKTTGVLIKPVGTAGSRVVKNAYNKGIINVENIINDGKHAQTFFKDDSIVKTSKGNDYALVQDIHKNKLQGDLGLNALKDTTNLGFNLPTKTTHTTGGFNVLTNEKYLLTGSPQPHWGGVKNTNFYNSVPLKTGEPVIALQFGQNLTKKAAAYEEGTSIVLRKPRNVSLLNADKVTDVSIDNLNNIMDDIASGNKANIVKKINAPELGGKKVIQPENLIKFSKEPQIGIQAQDIKPWGQKQAGSVLKTKEQIDVVRFYNKIDIAPNWLKDITKENSLASGAAKKTVNFLEKNKIINDIWDKSGIGRDWKKIDIIDVTYSRPQGRPPIQRDVDIRERPTLIDVQDNKALVGIDSKTGEYLLIGGGSDKFLGQGKIGLNATRWRLEDPKIGVVKETLQETGVEPKNIKRVLTQKDYFSPEYKFKSSANKGRQLIEYRVKDRLIPYEGKVDATKIKNMQGYENSFVDFVDVDKLLNSKKFNPGHKQVLADYLKKDNKLNKKYSIKEPKLNPKEYVKKTKVFEEAYSGKKYYSLLEDMPKDILSYSKGALGYRPQKQIYGPIYEPQSSKYYNKDQITYPEKPTPIVPEYNPDPTPNEPNPPYPIDYNPDPNYPNPPYPTTKYPEPPYPPTKYPTPKYPTPEIPGPKLPPIFELKAQKITEKKPQGSFDVYVRKGTGPATGKKRLVGAVLVEKNLPYNAALERGLGIADDYTQRTVLLKRSTKAPQYPDMGKVPQSLIDQFRPLRPKSKIKRGKQDLVFVEKSKFAIDENPEKKGIPYKSMEMRKAGIIPYKKKSAFGKFSGMRV